ncbi:MAG: glycosyl hydrolase [Myxococcales bacterium]|nr:glycosyl hydrolase [Myxococcales bacterium]
MSKHTVVLSLLSLLVVGACVSEVGGDGGDDGPGGGGGGGGGSGSGSGSGEVPEGFLFGPYKDTSINMDWNTNVISTLVPGTRTPLVDDMVAHGAKTVTISFATGECGSESWGGVPGAAMAQVNVPLFVGKDIDYILATGGAAGSFTCGSDAGMDAFLARWDSKNLVGVDYDIEAGQTEAQIGELIQRIIAAHAKYPKLRWQLTLATLANNDGSPKAVSLGSAAPSSFNIKGDQTLNAVKARLGFDGTAATWPSYVTVNLMVMDYGGPSPGVCVVTGGLCDMGQSAIQAAHNLHDHWGVPWSNIELTPMIGGNDVQDEHFSLEDADEMTAFAVANKLAGIHYWSYDRDTDCPKGPASPTCNSLGGIGPHGFLTRFIANGMN